MSGSWLAASAFALVIGTGIVWFRRAFALKLPRNRSGFVLAMVLAAGLGIAAFVLGTGWLAGAAAGFSIAAASVFLLLVAISAQKGGPGQLRAGSPMPDFTAPDENGEPFRFASLAGRPYLLKFFRGHW